MQLCNSAPGPARGFTIAVTVLALLAAVRVASTHRVFSEVLDEPAHLAAGYEWFRGVYDVDASHPPLARILAAFPLRDYPRPARTDFANMGNDLLYHGSYVRNVARMRLGNLVLLIAAVFATAFWARRMFSNAAGIVAAAMLTTLPPVLGHAGLATTDLAALTAIALALLALDCFLERPTLRRSALLGLALGIGLLAKFSFLVFFPPCALLAYAMRRRRSPLSLPGGRAVAALLIVVIAFLVLWAGYRFDFRTARDYAGDHAVYAVTQLTPLLADLPLPAPAFFAGLGLLSIHNAQGHGAYLLGEHSQTGWWYYFPVVFFYKTPLPYLFLALWGAVLAIRNRSLLAILLMAVAMLGVAMTSSINIGIRHILPLYVPLSVVAAYAALDIFNRSRDTFGRLAFAALLAWFFGGAALAHPDYLAWFNEAAQPNPARIAIDSNLDWGQDSLRLARVVREMGIEELHVDILTNVRLEEHGIRRVPFDAGVKTSGWLAVSETIVAAKAQWGQYRWLSSYRPVRKVGESIRLYYIP